MAAIPSCASQFERRTNGHNQSTKGDFCAEIEELRHP
jgi:hypothetical protein